MASVIPMQNIPNQALNVSLGGVLWLIRLVDCNTCMAVDIYQDDVPLLLGFRLNADAVIPPFKHLLGNGVLVLVTENGELPDWNKFGISQFLVHFGPDELRDM